MKFGRLILCMTLCVSAFAETDGIVRTAAGLMNAIAAKHIEHTPFRLEATVLSSPPAPRASFVVSDETGGVPVYDIRETNRPAVFPGDRVIVEGITEPRHRLSPEDGLLNANCTNIILLSRGSPPDPVEITPDDITNDGILYSPVVTKGILVDVRRDEIDSRFILFVLDVSGRMIYAATYYISFRSSLESLKRMVGATVAVSGILSRTSGSRIHNRKYITVPDEKSIQVIEAPSDKVFLAPDIGVTDDFSSEKIMALGRRRATGRVLAVWNGDEMLLRTASGTPMKVGFVSGPPEIGSCIEVVGYAGTDLFHVNLSNAIWRPCEDLGLPPEPVTDTTVKDLLVDKHGNRRINSRYHGKTVRLSGTVQDLVSDGRGSRRILLSSDGYTIPVDCGNAGAAMTGMKPGTRISVTGVCITETENWSGTSPLPRTLGMFIFVRRPNDVTVLSMPPWWTTGRLLTVIGALAFLLIAILIWNASLRTLSERRGRELFRSQIVRAESELRIDERTRLAAELHDHLAQNLTAIAYQLASAERSRSSVPEASSGHLATALRMLGSCRTELRRCLWDLRSDALDEPDISLAIRKSIAPVTGTTAVEVDFPIQRTKLSDSTVHAILSIARELAANAVNHGKAARIKVKGEISDGVLRFSVIDDGRGFDPSSAPGSADGHFGLDGVRDRLKKHGGSLSVESAPGKGCRVSVVFTSGKADDE